MKPIKYIFLFLIVCLSANIFALNSGKPLDYKKSQVLFVVSSDQGYIKKVGANYLMKLRLTDLNQMMFFTEQPYRLVRYVRNSALKKAWYSKTLNASFSHNPPNATLSTLKARPSVIVLTQMKMHGQYISFTFHPIKSGMFAIPTGSAHHLVLTIDSIAGADVLSRHMPAAPKGGSPSGAEVVMKHEGKASLKEYYDNTPEGKARNAAKAEKARIKNRDKMRKQQEQEEKKRAKRRKQREEDENENEDEDADNLSDSNETSDADSLTADTDAVDNPEDGLEMVDLSSVVRKGASATSDEAVVDSTLNEELSTEGGVDTVDATLDGLDVATTVGAEMGELAADAAMGLGMATGA